MKKYDEAQVAYRSALKEQPLLAGSLLGLGRALLATGTNTDQGITYIERAIRIRPQLKEGYYFLGQFFENSDPKKAVRYYRTFKKQAISDPEFAEELANASGKLEASAQKNTTGKREINSNTKL